MNNFDPLSPYNDLPPLPPKVELETKHVLKKCIEARSSLSELKMAGDLTPNQSVLINTIPLLEAKDSSEIENIVTTTDNLFRYAFDNMHQLPDAATKEALRYRTALHDGFISIEKKPLSTSTAINVCSAIKGSPMSVRKVPGTALANDSTGEVIYTPPVGEETILRKLSNLEKFLHYSTELDPLVRMAAGHYQFEAIHPFSDGNGRTGRVMNLLFLIQEGLLHQPILYLSRYILANRNEYYSLLLEVTTNESWEKWLLYILEGVVQTSVWTTQKISAIRSLSEHTADYIQTRLPKIYTRELLDVLFTQPYCRIGNLVEQGIAKRETSSAYLKRLCDEGILEESKVGRDKVFVHPKFLTLLTSENHEWVEY